MPLLLQSTSPVWSCVSQKHVLICLIWLTFARPCRLWMLCSNRRLEQYPSRELCGTDRQWGASRLDQPTRAQVPPRCPPGAPQVPPLSPQTTPSAPREFTNRGIVVLKLYCTCSIQKLVYTPCDYCQCSPVKTCVCCPYKSVKMVLVIEGLETAWPQIYYSMVNCWFAVTTW